MNIPCIRDFTDTIIPTLCSISLPILTTMLWNNAKQLKHVDDARQICCYDAAMMTD